MIRENEAKLLLELSKLINKFGMKSFSNLVSRLKDPSFISSIEAIDEVAQKLKKPKSKKTIKIDYNKKSKNIIDSISKSAPEKYELLKEISSRIDSKQFFRSLKEITAFVDNQDIYKKQVRSRHQGKYIIISHFINLNLSEIEQFLRKLEIMQHPDDRSLDAWSQVILTKPEKG